MSDYDDGNILVCLKFDLFRSAAFLLTFEEKKLTSVFYKMWNRLETLFLKCILVLFQKIISFGEHSLSLHLCLKGNGIGWTPRFPNLV